MSNCNLSLATLILTSVAMGALLPGLSHAGMRCGSRIIDRGTSGADVQSLGYGFNEP